MVLTKTRCGSFGWTSLFILASQPTHCTSTATYDLSPFEQHGVQAWLKLFDLGGPGNFTFTPNGSEPHPYSPSDVAHVLCFTGQLDLTDAEADAWADHINSFQLPPGSSRNGADATGFFENSDSKGVTGGTLWHAAGYVPAGLALIKRMPKYHNTLFEKIAGTPAMWQPWVDALLNANIKPPPANISSGCNDGYPCAQNIASPMAWLMMTNRNGSFASFQDWYFRYLKSKVDPSTGLWCTPEQKAQKGVGDCIGGSFHIDFVFTHAGESFPAPTAQLNASLAAQQKDGAWSDGNWYLNIDGIYQATRPSFQAGKLRWNEVQTACEKLMNHTVPALNNMDILLGSKVSPNSHILPALVSAVAECQHFFPDMVKTTRPWKMCLDEVPYI